MEQKKMTKTEAIRAMLDGKSVHYGSSGIPWNFNGSLFFRGGEIRDANDMVSGDWSIYTPPKEKVKMWQWVMQEDGNLSPHLTVYFYETAEECVGCEAARKKLIQRADWTEIEVEA